MNGWNCREVFGILLVVAFSLQGATAQTSVQAPAESEKSVDAGSVGPANAGARQDLSSTLDAFFQTYADVEQDRERQRESVEAALLTLMDRAKQQIEEIDSLQRKLGDARNAKSVLEKEKEFVKAQHANLQDQISGQQTEIIRLTKAKDQALQACRAREDTLASERAMHTEAAHAAQMAAAALRERLVEEEERVVMLAEALRALQQQARSLQEEARQEFAELELQLAQRTLASQEARNRVAALEDHRDLRESEWGRISEQFRLEQNALHAALQAERGRVETALEKIQLHERELQAQLQEQQRAAEVALKVSVDEITVLQLELAERDAKVEDLLAQKRQSTTTLALQEIDHLEREVARLERLRATEQENLRSRISELERALAAIVSERDALEAQLAVAP